MPITAEALGQRIKGARLAAGLTQDQLAAKAAVDKATVSRLELGSFSPRMETLYRITAALDLLVADIIADDYERTQ